MKENKLLSKFSARVEQTRYDNRFGSDRVLLIGVTKDGKKWRDHVWIKPRKNLMKQLHRGDIISFTGREYNYIDIDTNKPTKCGIKHLRNIQCN